MIQDYFDKIFIINLDRRKDRWSEVCQELRDHEISLNDVERFEAFDSPENGHYGCTRSHRTLIRKIANSDWKRVLVLEDDFQIITDDLLGKSGYTRMSPVRMTFRRVMNGQGTFNERFDFMSRFVPDDWDVLYLGASYGEDPIARMNQHVLRVGFMQTTSSYGITGEFAKKWDAKVNEDLGSDDLSRHPGPIDNTFGSMSHDNFYYTFQPRLMTQRASYSDLDGGTNSRLGQGTDPNHENKV